MSKLNDQDMDLLRQVAASAKKSALFKDLIINLADEIYKLRDIERSRQVRTKETDDLLNLWDEARKVE